MVENKKSRLILMIMTVLMISVMGFICPEKIEAGSYYTVNFNRQDGTTGYSQTMYEGQQLPTITRDGYTFDGWYTQPTNGSKVTYVTGNMTVFAHWTAATYRITFDLQTGAGTYTKQYKYGDTLPDATRTGYNFDGWYTSGGVRIKTVTQTQTLYAHWSVAYYSVTFNPNNGSSSYTQYLAYGTQLSNLSWSGHTFDGWYTAMVGGDKVTTVTSSQPLVAHWSLISYNTTFYPDNGTAAYTKAYPYGTELPTPSREGYTFEGWYTSNGTRIYTVTQDRTVYARWKVKSFTITFNPNNGTAAYSQTLDYGTTLPNLSWGGHTFDGWYTAASGGERVTTVTKSEGVVAHWTLNSYNITFYPQRNNESAYTKTLKYGEALPALSWTGHTFNGWYTAASNGTQVKTVTQSQTVYAHWTINKYTVTFNPNNGQAAYKKTLDYGTTLSNPEAWTGHTFNGWYTKPSEGDKVTKVTGTQTVFAHWTINKYTITFNPNHDKLSTYTQSLNYGTTLPKPSARTGYTFAGWYTAASGGTQVTTVSKTQTVYAHWTVNSYTVTFNPNNAQAAYEKQLNYGTTLPNPAAWTGHTFDGWYTKPSGGDRVTKVTGTQTVFAHWTLNQYTITFNPNHDSLSTYTKTLNYGAALPNPSARTGYTFAGWYTAASGGTQVATVSKAQTVYAHWTVNSYTVTFNPNNAQAAYEKQLNYGATLPNPPAWTGHTFAGWYTKPSGGDKVTKVTGKQTVFAHWTLNQYTITFNPNHDSLSTYTKTLNYGTTLPKPSARTGYTFDGWYTAASGGAQVTTVSKEQTVYAHWTINKYTITFNPNHDSLSTYTKQLNYGTALPNPSARTGYKFAGWYTAASSGTQVTTVSKTQTVYAHWTVNSYTITFDPNHDNLSTYTKSLNYGTALPNPSARTGYTFAGWYTAASDGNRVTKVSQTQKVYAHWTVNKYTVTFNPNNGQATYTKELNYGATLPNPATWTGHTFDGWYTKPSGGDKVTKVTGTQTVFAHWSLAKYKITFDVNGTKVTKTLEYNATLPTLEGLNQAELLKTAVKGTQVFVKWVDAKSNECKKVDGVTTSVKAVFETLSVSLKQNGGSGSAKLVNTTNGFIIYPGNLKKDGYVISGWNTKSDGTGKSFTMGQQYTAASLIASGETFPTQKTVTLYAVWKKLSKNAITISVVVPAKQDIDLMLPDTGEYTYSIKWTGNGAQSYCDTVVGDTSGNSISFETGNATGKAVVLNSKNYLMKLTNRANSDSCTATVTLKKTGVFVTYDYNHPGHPRSKNPTIIVCKIDQPYKLPTMYSVDEEITVSVGIEMCYNYVRFDGWWTKPGDNQGQRIDNTIKMTSEKDVTLYAHWKKWSPQWDTFVEECKAASNLDVDKLRDELGITEDMFVNYGVYEGERPTITTAGTVGYISYVIRTKPPFTSYILVYSSANIPDTHNSISDDVHRPEKQLKELLVATEIWVSSGELYVQSVSSDTPMIEARIEDSNPDLILTTTECVKKYSSGSSRPKVFVSVLKVVDKICVVLNPIDWSLPTMMNALVDLSTDEFFTMETKSVSNTSEFTINCNDYQLPIPKKVRAFGINIGSEDFLNNPNHNLQGDIILSWPKDGYFPTNMTNKPECKQIEYKLITEESKKRGVKVSFNFLVVDSYSSENLKEFKYSTVLRYQ